VYVATGTPTTTKTGAARRGSEASFLAMIGLDSWRLFWKHVYDQKESSRVKVLTGKYGWHCLLLLLSYQICWSGDFL
jgi:hypothetical protein